MTTMNNVMNITKATDSITMRCTIVNGESWDLLLDISSLTKAEVAPVLAYLAGGKLNARFHTPKIRRFIQEVAEGAAEVLMRFCFDGGKYDHFYAVKLISDVLEAGLCCEDCGVREVTQLHQLYVEYLDGSETAEQQIAQNLYTFFAKTLPFVFDVI